MFASLFAFGYALGIFALMSEVSSPALLAVGWFMNSWLIIAGTFSGWSAFRK